MATTDADDRRRRGRLRHLRRALVFLAGLLCIATGIALAVLPGPLTIPPVLLGLWIWSTEFAFAHRLFHAFRVKGDEALEHAKRHPITTSVITAAGLLGAVVIVWAVARYDLLPWS